jgi:Domain of unknown function (DUF1824)
MTAQSSLDPFVTEALKLLKQYSCIDIKTAESESDREQLRQAIILVTSLSEYNNLGICADDEKAGFAALTDYLKALGYDTKVEFASDPEIEGAVYIKFNMQKMSYYLDSYTGTYRGVLVSCQSENDKIVGTYGHFPLDLFSKV